jgi:hypothetical protein
LLIRDAATMSSKSLANSIVNPFSFSSERKRAVARI